MRPSQKMMLAWLLINALYGVMIVALPHRGIPVSTFISYSVQTLLFLLSVRLFLREPARKNRYIFLNFAVFFSIGGFAAHFINFVGHEGVVITGDPWIRAILDQYIFRIGYYAAMALAVIYITIDLLLRDFATVKKYLVAFGIVGGFVGYYYAPFLADRWYFKQTDEMRQWKDLDNAFAAYQEEHGAVPKVDDLVSEPFEMYAYSDQRPIGTLYPEERELRIRELFPYVAGEGNYMILMFKPFHLNGIQMSVLCIGFILLFFGYQYMKDPPQGAYIEKIVFLMLVFCTLEVLHAYSFIHTLQWEAFSSVLEVGSNISVAVLLLLSAFFALRLRFVTSVKGEFYEQELAVSPGGITRWRDLMDNVVIEKFFNRKLLLGRFMVDPGSERYSR